MARGCANVALFQVYLRLNGEELYDCEPSLKLCCRQPQILPADVEAACIISCTTGAQPDRPISGGLLQVQKIIFLEAFISLGRQLAWTHAILPSNCQQSRSKKF